MHPQNLLANPPTLQDSAKRILAAAYLVADLLVVHVQEWKELQDLPGRQFL
jgi:hypothetical protein